ncbi:hemagglutinin repeat-containing protein [Canicola haemoglobinophilus]|uniref:hemagglutinin repeat-containing protein n=1 Tax=Canicola haemoglobinophilus TaxID=733 RepID=UPI002286DAFA|nr:hemagglutinin repeat-containing protein [Canicola haemoglobinophilus]
MVQGKEVNISSQHDTALQGAKVNADRLTMKVGNNLSIESRQDSNQYDSKQTQVNAGASVTLNGSGSASINASRNKAKLNYAQVEEQSGLSAGEGGLAINVGNHTHLKGGLIESKAEESKNRLHTKTFSTEDIKNHSEVKVESHSVGLSTNMAQNAMSAVATTIGVLSNKNESKQTLTRSAVGNNIHFTAESQDEKTQQNLTALSRDTENANQKVQAYDLAEMRENQELANVAGQVGARLVGDVSQMLEWEEGSPQKIALHAVVGALAAKWSDGNVAVGAGAGALSEWANSQIEDYLKNHPELNLSQDERYAIQQATAAALGAAVGAVIGGNSESVGQGALTAYNAEKFNRQLHPKEIDLIKAKASAYAREQNISEEEAIAQLTEESLRGVSDDAVHLVKNEPARQYLDKLRAEIGEPWLFDVLNRNSTEYKNSLIYADGIGKYQDVYNKARLNHSIMSTHEQLLVRGLRESSNYHKQVGKETVLSVYGDTLKAIEFNHKLAEELKRQPDDNAEALGYRYERAGNQLSDIISSSYPNARGLFNLGEFLSQDNAYGKAAMGAIAQSGWATGIGKASQYLKKTPVIGKVTNYGEPTATFNLSSGAENAALYPRLKEQLFQENLNNIVNKNPILEHAAFGVGNLTLKGAYSKVEIEKLAREWVGNGAIRNSDGGFTSADGTRRYRPPTSKKHSTYAETGIQANFERGISIENPNGTKSFRSESNLHLNIKDN